MSLKTTLKWSMLISSPLLLLKTSWFTSLESWYQFLFGTWRTTAEFLRTSINSFTIIHWSSWRGRQVYCWFEKWSFGEKQSLCTVALPGVSVKGGQSKGKECHNCLLHDIIYVKHNILERTNNFPRGACPPPPCPWLRHFSMTIVFLKFPMGNLCLVSFYFVSSFLKELLSDRDVRGKGAELNGLNQNIRHLLSMWFSVGFLKLERITWQSPCDVTEKVWGYITRSLSASKSSKSFLF